MKQWLLGLVAKIGVAFNKALDIVFTRSVELVDTIVVMFKQQISTPKGAFVFIVIALLVLELIGFSILGVNLEKLKAFIAIIQPIIGWVVALIAIVVIGFSIKK